MHMDYVIFLILSNIAYTKFSEGPNALNELLTFEAEFRRVIFAAFVQRGKDRQSIDPETSDNHTSAHSRHRKQLAAYACIPRHKSDDICMSYIAGISMPYSRKRIRNVEPVSAPSMTASSDSPCRTDPENKSRRDTHCHPIRPQFAVCSVHPVRMPLPYQRPTG